MVAQINEELAPVVYVNTWRKTMDITPYGMFDIDASMTDYVTRTQNAGAIVLQVPRDVPDRAPQILAGADALVIIGGEDVDPSFYGQEPAGSKSTNAEADAFDLALIHEAKRRNLPVFAICRGHQLLNVAFGGTLHQDIAQEPVKHTPGPALPGESPVAEHDIEIAPDSRFIGAVLGETARTNSIHHQSVDRCAPGFRVVATAPDGIVEAIEPETGDWLALSVQWHPEKMAEHQRLFDWFVARVRERPRR
ncbi:gamma-glutamyl-gamma-aminobutyrate hydrolase family protein [Leucobacter albus]|uniref:Gamma-glutamyl-gamma-aminobutyrate hydrolase family protein n=1 Tax=Leucobacter albus TaxID=272210 RepID=A0ABW3TM85_9MICO